MIFYIHINVFKQKSHPIIQQKVLNTAILYYLSTTIVLMNAVSTEKPIVPRLLTFSSCV